MRESHDIEQAIATFGDAVWRACLVYISPSEAEDVFQNTFISYAMHDADFSNAEHVRAWLLRVAINNCKDILKSARKQNASLDELIETGGASSFGTTDDNIHALREALDALNALDDPPKTQLYLSLCEGYSAPEIAKMLDMPLGTVYSWISRGKRKLREVLS